MAWSKIFMHRLIWQIAIDFFFCGCIKELKLLFVFFFFFLFFFQKWDLLHSRLGQLLSVFHVQEIRITWLFAACHALLSTYMYVFYICFSKNQQRLKNCCFGWRVWGKLKKSSWCFYIYLQTSVYLCLPYFFLLLKVTCKPLEIRCFSDPLLFKETKTKSACVCSLIF